MLLSWYTQCNGTWPHTVFIVILKYMREKMYTTLKIRSLLKWEWLICSMTYHTLSYCRFGAIDTPTTYIWAVCGCQEFASTNLKASCAVYSVFFLYFIKICIICTLLETNKDPCFYLCTANAWELLLSNLQSNSWSLKKNSSPVQASLYISKWIIRNILLPKRRQV
jgi:hypothetical protein